LFDAKIPEFGLFLGFLPLNLNFLNIGFCEFLGLKFILALLGGKWSWASVGMARWGGR
jgi:hypothetical protein